MPRALAPLYTQSLIDKGEVAVVFLVATAAGAGETAVEAAPAFAHPANLSCRNPGDEGVVFDIFGDNGTGGDQGAATHSVAADDGAVGSQRGPFFYQRLGVDTVHGEVGTGGDDIGEDA